MDNLDTKLNSVVSELSVEPKNSKISKFVPIIILLILIIAGVFSGLIFSSRSKNIAIQQSSIVDDANLNPEQKQAAQVVTRDSAEGTIEKNDDYEETAQGQWKLIRAGGESQTAYLTSSYIDLDQFVGKKVKVFGETLGTDKVAWLMDVAKVEVQ